MGGLLFIVYYSQEQIIVGGPTIIMANAAKFQNSWPIEQLWVGMRLLCSKSWALYFWAVLQKSTIMLLRNAHYSQNYATDFGQ